MDQADKALHFKDLHVKGAPLVLYNIWDAGSAKAVAKAGARALATGSAPLAAAQGYGDGQQIPLQMALHITSRIVETSDLPVSFDFEGGFANHPDALADNTARAVAAGIVGVNFEDQILGGDGLHPIDTQSTRINAIRTAAGVAGVPLFINARTDLFLKAGLDADHAPLLDDAIARAQAYAAAGADGFFAPGLTDLDLIEQLCAATDLPVNILMIGELRDLAPLAQRGVARISHGPFPHRALMAQLTASAQQALQDH